MKNYLAFLFLLLSPALILASGQESAPSTPGKQVRLEDLSEETLAQAQEKSEKFEFQAEVNRMMKLIIHSLYKSKEIFLRELISNASDALDKIRFLSLTKPEELGNTPDLAIYIKSDPDTKTITITDTGIGMTKADLVKNLGTIAKSGTAEFLTQVEKNSGDNSNLIGQFGVGFYSAFLVADKVSVVSKHNDDRQHIWESYAESDFTVVEDPRGNTLGRGTSITLYIKDDAEEFLNDAVLEEVIRKYSEFINFPIYLWVNKTEALDLPMLDQEIEEREGVSGEKVEEVDAETGETLPAADAEEKEAPVDDEEEPKKAPFDDSIAEKTGINPDKYDRSDKKNRKVEYRWYYDWELMNPQRPIWTRNPQNVTEEEYSSFYKAAFEQTEDPMTHLHFHAEGDVDFAAILFVPKTAEDNQLQKSDQHLKNIKLFVKRVFITNELMDFMPRWLGFVRGMVDSDDLPLNVSRETLQKHRLLKLIRRKMIRKCLDLIKTLSLDESKYEEFLKEYGVNLKLGVIEDAKNRKKIMKLLRVTTSKAKKKISLETYVQRMKPNQEQIYFLTGNSVDEIKRSPFVEPFVARGYEVIYFDEPIDEYLVQALKDFQHKPFQNIAKAGVKLPDEEDVDAETTEKFVPLTNYLLLQFGDAIENVKLSNRLVTSPCSLVANSQGWSGHMEKMMSAQAIRTQNDEVLRMFNAQKKKVLEINPKHPIINNLLERVLEDKHDPQLKENTVLLFELTQLRSGFEVADQNDFTTRIEGALKAALGVPLDAKVEGVDEVFAEEEEEIVPDTPETPLDGEVAEAAGESDVVEAEETEEDESEVEFNSKRRRAEYTAEEEHKEWKEERERLEAAEEKAHREGLERQKEQRLKEERAKRKKVKRADDEDLPDDDHDEL